MKEIELLIATLQDQHANVAEKDDAAMDLGDSDDLLAIQALAARACDPKEDDLVLNSCGESLAEIWIRNDSFDHKLYESLLPKAKHGAHLVMKSLRPEWEVASVIEKKNK